jgi:hypothetical protein
METVSLIASIVAIILAFFAIWQANEYKKQSDKLNRDTTEKLARIEAFATMTKEDAFSELSKWNELARKGFIIFEEFKEEKLNQLIQELHDRTAREIDKVWGLVEKKLKESLSKTVTKSTLDDIKSEFEELRIEIAKIQGKVDVVAKDALKQARIQTILDRLPFAREVVKLCVENPEMGMKELEMKAYDAKAIRMLVGLLKSMSLIKTGPKGEWVIDDDFKEAVRAGW